MIAVERRDEGKGKDKQITHIKLHRHKCRHKVKSSNTCKYKNMTHQEVLVGVTVEQ